MDGGGAGSGQRVDREGGGGDKEKVPLSKAESSNANKDSRELKQQDGRRSEGELRVQRGGGGEVRGRGGKLTHKEYGKWNIPQLTQELRL